MNKDGQLALTCLGIIALVVIVIAVSTVILMLAWGWVVPDVFAGAVEKGIIPASITFWQALKLGVLAGILSGWFRISSSSE